MANGLVIAGRRVKLRFFLFLAIAMSIILYICRPLFQQPSFYTIQYGEITSWNECNGIVIRQEKAYDTSDYGKVDFYVASGDLVEKDSLLAILYKDSYDRGLVDDLYKIKSKISDYQNKNLVQDIIDADFEKIQDNIIETMYTIQENISNGVAKNMPKLENQLRGLLSRRKEILDKEDYTNSYLEQLYEQEKDIEAKLAEWKVEIHAPESGIISFKPDGLEELLTPFKIEFLNSEQFQSLKDHEGLKSNHEGNSAMDIPLFKIVVPDSWYIAALIPNSEVYYKKGDYVRVNLLGISESIVEAEVHRVDTAKDSIFIILEMNQALEDVLETRNIRIEIGTTTYGLVVPRNAIIDRKGEIGVKVDNSGDVEFKRIRILAMDDKWVVIESLDKDGNIKLNDRVIVNKK